MMTWKDISFRNQTLHIYLYINISHIYIQIFLMSLHFKCIEIWYFKSTIGNHMHWMKYLSCVQQYICGKTHVMLLFFRLFLSVRTVFTLKELKMNLNAKVKQHSYSQTKWQTPHWVCIDQYDDVFGLKKVLMTSS